jgi:two-component system, NarL family, sensor kinase
VSAEVLSSTTGDGVGPDRPARPRNRPPWLQRPRFSRPPREIAAFVAVGLLVLVAVSAGILVISERIARSNALAEAERAGTRLGQTLVAPLMTEYLRGTPGAFEDLDRIVGYRLSDGSVTSVNVWTPQGEVLYSSDSELIGATFPPSDELRAAARGEVVSDVDDAPEEAYEGLAPEPMLEVYAPMTAAGQSLVFEAYYSYDRIAREAAALRWQIIPLAVGGIVVVQLVQIPIASSLARRARRNESERSELMARTLDASERERRAIAADLHDGPVQDLAGVSYALGALQLSMPPEQHAIAERLGGAIRHAVASLRRLMVEIYPPDLSGPGLGDALHDLAERLRGQGISPSVDAGPLPPLSPEVAAAVYRAAKESLTNVATHAQAEHVWVRLAETTDERGAAVLLEVADDGVGFPDAGIDRRTEGHLGLRLVIDRVAHLGGRVTCGERPGGGAVVTAVLPINHEE